MWTDRSSTPTRPRVIAALLCVSLLAPFLGGSTEPWAWGVMSLLIGLFFVGLPPRHWLPMPVYLPALLLLLLPAAAFLPAAWFATPFWRAGLTKDLELALPWTVTPQPWLAVESWLLLALGVCWLVYATSLLMTSRSRCNLARFYVTGAGILAGMAILFSLAHESLPFWHARQHFGFFPNRNQMGDWLALAGILVPALIYEDWGRNRLLTVWWILVLAVISTALVMNYSRAGVLLFFGGVVVFLVWLSVSRRWTARLVVGLTLIFVLVTLFFLFGGATRDRLQKGARTADEPKYSRVAIHQDALAMKRTTSWPGVGLGNFNAVFPFYRNASLSEDHVLHPESDWLWLLDEAGWSALVVAGCGAMALLALAFPLERGSGRGVRLAAMLGVIAFAVHGIVDVSAHRLGSFLPVCLFATLMIHPRYHEPVHGAIRHGFRWLGLFWMAVGAYWIFSWYAPGLWPTTAGVTRAKKIADVAIQQGDNATAQRAMTRALVWAPLDWELYYRRAMVEMRSDSAQARMDFLRARALEPTSSLLPKQEGLLWLPLSPVYALTAWNEALRRDRHNVGELYSELLLAGGDSPIVRDGLKRLAMERPELFLVFVANTNPDEFRTMRLQLLGRDPQLASFESTQRQLFFHYWAQKEGLNSLVEAVQQHPSWRTSAASFLTDDMAARGDYQQAYSVRHANTPEPIYPQFDSTATLENLQTRLLQRPDDFAAAYLLIRKQLIASNPTAALEQAREIVKQKNCPAYFYFLQAEVAAQLDRWPEAWDALNRYNTLRSQ